VVVQQSTQELNAADNRLNRPQDVEKTVAERTVGPPRTFAARRLSTSSALDRPLRSSITSNGALTNGSISTPRRSTERVEDAEPES
jgi:hypothetical protein